MLAIISIAILVSVFFTLDLIQSPKKGGFYLRNLIQVICISVPSIYKSVQNSDAQFLIYWNSYFYCIFFIAFSVLMLIVYIFHYKKLAYSAEKYGVVKKFSFIEFIQNGNKNFQNEINELIKESEKNKNIITSSVFKSIRNSLPKFVCDLNLALIDNSSKDLVDYSCFVLESFISHFIPHSDARFSIRKYNAETNEMEAIFSTRREEIPSPIPLNKKNLILLSMKTKRPEIYSRNKKNHYDTKKSMKENVYDDYVTYCILAEKNIPQISVNLDVVGHQATKRMHVLVDYSIFTIICDMIKIKSIALNSK